MIGGLGKGKHHFNSFTDINPRYSDIPTKNIQTLDTTTSLYPQLSTVPQQGGENGGGSIPEKDPIPFSPENRLSTPKNHLPGKAHTIPIPTSIIIMGSPLQNQCREKQNKSEERKKEK